MGQLIPFPRPLRQVARAARAAPRVSIRRVRVGKSRQHPSGWAYEVHAGGVGIWAHKIRVNTKRQALRARANVRAGRDMTAGVY